MHYRRRRNDDNDDDTKYVCATRAKSQYGLTERDLDALECRYVPNPHYRSAAPMRLYKVDDVEELQTKNQQTARESNAIRVTPEEKEAARKAKQRAENDSATAKVMDFASSSSSARLHGSSDLDTCPMPIDVWTHVLCSLAADMDPLRSMSVVVQDVCRAALTCRDFRIASRAALQILSSTPRTSTFNYDNNDDELRAPLVKTPMSMRLVDLKTIARNVGVHVSGTKAVLVVRIYAKLKLAAPSEWAPASLVWLMHHERSTPFTQDPAMEALCTRGIKLGAFYMPQHGSNMLHGRLRLLTMFKSHADIVRELDAKEEKKRQGWISLKRQRLTTSTSNTNDSCVQCTRNLASQRCVIHMCRRCCTGPCAFHGL